MGVAQRYKSTGDMLSCVSSMTKTIEADDKNKNNNKNSDIQESSYNKKQLDYSEEEEGNELGLELDGDFDNENQRVRPLLGRRRSRDGKFGERTKWASCKLFGTYDNNDDHTDDPYSMQRFQGQKPNHEIIELKSYSHPKGAALEQTEPKTNYQLDQGQSKSLADFLFVSLEPAEVRAQPAGIDWPPDEPATVDLEPTKAATTKFYTKKRAFRCEGARGKRRAALSSRKRRLASLSLSSPALAAQRQQQLGGRLAEDTKVSLERESCFVDVGELDDVSAVAAAGQQEQQLNTITGYFKNNSNSTEGNDFDAIEYDNNDNGFSKSSAGGQQENSCELMQREACQAARLQDQRQSQSQQQLEQRQEIQYSLSGAVQVPVQQQQLQQIQIKDREFSYGSKANLTTNNLMLNLNITANKLVGSCCKALQPNSSGSYKVARLHQQQPVSGSLQEQETNSSANNGNQDSGCESAIIGSCCGTTTTTAISTANGKVARISRPGRSPVSLRRQTNARLTRHRLKIQQQRNQQLVQLALRERQQLASNNSQSFASISHYHRQQPENQHVNQQQHQANLTHAAPTGHESIYLINGFIDRQRLATGTAQQQQQDPLRDRSRNNCHLDYRLALENFEQQQQRRQPHQEIVPITNTAIEICDNQLACSSRQNPVRGVQLMGGEDQPTGRSQRTTIANVVAYKSINMARKQSNNANSSSTRHKHRMVFDDYNEEIESESDAQTLNGSITSLNRPFCKICHIGASKNGDKLISPCKCSGTMQYIHCGCLLKWLEISNRTNEKPMSCELCSHEYTWHKKFNYHQARLPKCSVKDVFLHLIFVAAIGVMFFSALAPILFKRSQRDPGGSNLATEDNFDRQHQDYKSKAEQQLQVRHHIAVSPFHQATFGSQTSHNLVTNRLASDEKFMLLCAASFFVSFFVAIYVQTKARDTLYGLITKFVCMNQTYYITEYDHGGQLNNNSNNTSAKNQQQQYDELRLDRKSSQKS